MNDPQIPTGDPYLRRLLFLAAISLSCVLVGFSIKDKLIEGDSRRPSIDYRWFDKDWWRDPITHWRLRNEPGRDYWSQNAIGTQRWYVREISYDGSIYWTILKNVPVEGPPYMSKEYRGWTNHDLAGDMVFESLRQYAVPGGK